MAYEQETSETPKGSIVFFSWIGVLTAIAIAIESLFGKQYDESGQEIKKDKNGKVIK